MIYLICFLTIVLLLVLVHRAKCYADYAEEQLRLAETWMNEALAEKRKTVLIRDQASNALAHVARVHVDR